MITKFQIFEVINQGLPEYGDYVICGDSVTGIECEFHDYIRTVIGQIVDIGPPNHLKRLEPNNGDDADFYILEYDGNQPDFDNQGFYSGYNGNRRDGMCITNNTKIMLDPTKKYLYWRGRFDYWSPNKKDLETILRGRTFDL